MAPSGILDLLADACSGSGAIRFIPDHPEPISVAGLWRRSGRAARWLSAHVPAGSAVAMAMASTPDAVAALVGAWRAGITVASLPGPARGVSATEYQRQVEQACQLVGAQLLVVDDVLLPLLPPLAIPVAGFTSCQTSPAARSPAPPARPARPANDASAAGGADGADGTDGRADFVQFTSGSTATAKGVRLTLDAVAANVTAILAALEPQPGDGACSWLPLSHDMGLIGMLLASWVATRPACLGRGELTLIRPEYFLRNPASWLLACSETGATTTAAPDFGYALAARVLPAGGRLDLSRLRVCICGGETIQWATLQQFAAAAAPAGFRSRAFCPAYGLAEATLAVTMVRPEQQPAIRYADPAGLAAGEWHDRPDGLGLAVVGAGAPLPGMDCRISGGSGGLGAVEVAGPSLFTGYTGYTGRGSPSLTDGWLRTSDIGAIIGGELYPVGRSDDRIVTAGRSLDARQAERCVGGHYGIRPGGAAAVEDGAGGFVIVAEPATAAAAAGYDQKEMAYAVRDAVVGSTGFAPSAVLLVPPGSLPKTPSGKLQRFRIRSLLHTGELEQLASVRFRGKST